MAEHTRLPWRRDSEFITTVAGPFVLIARLDANSWEGCREANGDFIVRACNSHEALLAACQMAAGALAMVTPSLGSPDWYVNAIEDAKRDCAAAIASARGDA